MGKDTKFQLPVIGYNESVSFFSYERISNFVLIFFQSWLVLKKKNSKQFNFYIKNK